MLNFSMKPGYKSFTAKRARIFGGWLCLFAAVLLWSPLWAAALQANGMGCCDGTLCAAHPKSHGHPIDKTGPAAPSANQQQAPMDCDHGDSRLPSCTISCCQDSSSSFVAAIVFVVPAPALLKNAALSIPIPPAPSQQKFSRNCDLPSPPPRTSAISA